MQKSSEEKPSTSWGIRMPDFSAAAAAVGGAVTSIQNVGGAVTGAVTGAVDGAIGKTTNAGKALAALVNPETHCEKCHQSPNVASQYFNKSRWDPMRQCGVCGNKNRCGNCAKKSKFPIPDKIKIANFLYDQDMHCYICQGEGGATSECEKSLDHAFDAEFCLALRETIGISKSIQLWKTSHGNFYPYWKKPSLTDNDTFWDKVKRGLHLVDQYSGYIPAGMIVSTGVKAVDAALSAPMKDQDYGAGIGEKLVKIYLPFLRAMGSYFEDSEIFSNSMAVAVCNLYYYICKLELDRKRQDFHSSPQLDDRNVKEMITLFGDHWGMAQWPYAAKLSAPHDTSSWSLWYLSCLIKPNGWNLLAYLHDSISLPSGKQVPAFALAVNDFKKEVCLTVRGSNSASDWDIIFQLNCERFQYKGIVGRAHFGSLVAARVILDDLGVRDALEELLSLGYKVTCVGHSLGAAVALLMTAMIFDSYLTRGQNPQIQCLAYACPACTSENIGNLLWSICSHRILFF